MACVHLAPMLQLPHSSHNITLATTTHTNPFAADLLLHCLHIVPNLPCRPLPSCLIILSPCLPLSCTRVPCRLGATARSCLTSVLSA